MNISALFYHINVLCHIVLLFSIVTVISLQISHSPPPAAWCFPKGFYFLFSCCMYILNEAFWFWLQETDVAHHIIEANLRIIGNILSDEANGRWSCSYNTQTPLFSLWEAASLKSVFYPLGQPSCHHNVCARTAFRIPQGFCDHSERRKLPFVFKLNWFSNHSKNITMWFWQHVPALFILTV